VISEGD